MIVTLTPNPSLDRTLFLDTFTRGAVNRCTATLVEPSGKGINVALALHSHGVPALAVLPSGGPAGEQLVQLREALHDVVGSRLEPLLTRRLTNLGWKTPSTTLT